MNKALKIILGLLCIGIGVGICSNDSYADTLETIGQKSEIQGAYKCYAESKLEKSSASYYEPDGSHKSYKAGTYQVRTDVKQFFDIRQIAPFPEGTAHVLLPNELTDEKNGSKNNKTNCNHLISGADNNIGSGGDGFKETIFKRFNKPEPSSADANNIEAMKKIGYEPSAGSSGGGSSYSNEACIHIKYKYKTAKAAFGGEDNGTLVDDSGTPISEASETVYYYNRKLCPNLDSDGYLKSITEQAETNKPVWVAKGTGAKPWFRVGINGELGFLIGSSSTHTPCLNWSDCEGSATEYTEGKGTSDTNYINYSSKKYRWDKALGILEKYAESITAGNDAGMPGFLGGGGEDAYGTFITYVEIVQDGAGSDAGAYSNNFKIMSDRKAAAEKVVSYLGYSTKKDVSNSMRLNESQRVFLYQYYINAIAKAGVTCEDPGDATATKVLWFETANKREECWITAVVEANKMKFTLVGDIGGSDATAGMFISQGTLTEVVDKLNKIKIDKLQGIDDSELSAVAQMALQSTDTPSTATYDCYSRAESLGWVLCPIIDNLGNYIQRTYEQHITNFLVLDAGLFENGGTLQAWRNFQTIANVFFVIVFLVVILSQLTGFGIDNYGIKKILPKLVVSAILINLSYFICQIAIEVANIVGYGIGQIFESIGTQVAEIKISEAASVAGNATESSGSAAGAVAIIIVLVGALVAGAVLAIGPSVLVPVFLGLIAIAIAILACFVILAVRKALAVVLVVISPVAFVCYMLPNTKSLFRRWLKAFEGVIIAFPVCSAMIYGGQAVSRLVINGSGSTTVPFMLALSAAVIAVIPMYFIPRVVSKSMGAISAGINGVASRARVAGQNRYRNSNGAQDRMLRSQQLQNRRAAGETLVSRHIRGAGDKAYGALRNTRLGSSRIGSRLLDNRENARNQRLARADARYVRDLDDINSAKRLTSPENKKRQIFNNEVKSYMDSAEFELDTGHGNIDQMYDQMLSAGQQGDDVKMRAMGKALAATKEGKKRLINGIRSGQIAGDTYSKLSEDESIRSAIHEKDQFVAAAMASGQDWKSWSSDQTNMQKVVKNLDKSDLYSQSSDAFQDALRTEDANGNRMISNERLTADMANPNIDMGDKRDIITAGVGQYNGAARGLSASDPNAKLADAMNNLAGEMKINREKGTLSGGYPGGPSLSGHNAQQQSKNNGGGGIGNAGNVPD